MVKNSNKKTHSPMPPPSKSAALDRRKRKADTMTTSGLEDPSKSNTEKEALQQKKAVREVVSGNSTSGTSFPPEMGGSDAEADSNLDDKMVARFVQRRQRKRGEKTEREFTDYKCRKQLAALKMSTKRPPPAMTADTFASRYSGLRSP